MQLPTGYQDVSDDGAERLRLQLLTEISGAHVLSPLSETLKVIARSESSPDDILISTGDAGRPLAIVHLTWTTGPNPDPMFPFVTFYPSVFAIEATA